MGGMDWLIVLAIGFLAGLAIRRMMRNKGRCSGGCIGCPHGSACSRKNSKHQKKGARK